MSWTTPADLRAQVERLWVRGELLRACVSDAIAWPLRLRLKAPGTADLSDRFEAVRAWERTMMQMRQVRVETRETTHRVQGRQRLPHAVWVDSLEDALALVGRARDAQRFRHLWQQTAAERPALLAWLSKRPLQALALEEPWTRLLSVVAWLEAHPRPGTYLRQIDIPGNDSKFIETHRGVLAEWLDLALSADYIDTSVSGAAHFERRYGFRAKPVRLRFRLLDPALPSLPGCRGLPDISLDAASFATLEIPATRVFITENETNFLAFPRAPRSLVVFGAGYGWDALASAAWMQRCAIHYWGDIDTHGFAILHQLRHHLPRVSSFLMDRLTLQTHRMQWGVERQPVRHELERLTPEEGALYDDLRFDRIQPGLRLEQEHIGYGWVERELEKLIAAPCTAQP
ncbi:MAG: hypothetical protein HY749_17865 [Gammaproteobacteria bacterium]|nr:hypothetical protein [Gammaproteobacteria bacterium]